MHVSELQTATRVKPLFQRMEQFIDGCEGAVTRAFYAAGLDHMGHKILLSADDQAYQIFVANCQKLRIAPADRATWERITRGIPNFQNMVGVKASNRTGG